MNFIKKKHSFGPSEKHHKSKHAVRTCHLKKTHGEEYGFNLRSKNLHECCYVGIVDKDTPADSAGLRSGDRILEINKTNVNGFNHEEIVCLIKRGVSRIGVLFVNEVILVVADKQTDEYFSKLSELNK